MKLKDNKIILVIVNQNYLKFLSGYDNEVYFKETNYENKPYLGVLVTFNNDEYAIPFSSAKQKYKYYSDFYDGKMLIYENAVPSRMSKKDVWILQSNGTAKHILAILNIGKMIPLKNGCYTIVNINHSSIDSVRERKYKDLLNKEFQFCVRHKEEILNRSVEIYIEQLKTKVIKFSYCDFKKLEMARDSYKI